jgi:hypothetical protein
VVARRRQGGEGRGAPERRVDGEAAQTASGDNVRQWGGGSSGWRRWVWGPAAPVREKEAEVSSNLGMMQLGGRSPERGKTAVELGKIQHEGEESGGRSQRYERENCGEGGDAREGGRSGSVSREWTSGRGRALSGLVGSAAERERKERGGGPAAEVPRGMGRRHDAWPRPAGGALTVSRSAVT